MKRIRFLATLDHREFLSPAATATAVLATSNRVSAAEAPRRIPVGFLGATCPRGPDGIKPAINSPDWELVGVCEAFEAGRETRAKVGAKLSTRDGLFQRAWVVAMESKVCETSDRL